jgi:hypothetical protein
MEQDVLKTNLLSIAVAGFLIMLVGTLLYFFRNDISDNIRFFMPIPPLGVAAYIFVFNMYSYHGGNLPEGTWQTAKEIIFGISISAFAFTIFTILLIFIIYLLRR